MRYKNIQPATFIQRPNRFIAVVEKENGAQIKAHVKNTGRCAELLVPGCRVYLEYSDNAARKTPCDLVAVEKETPHGKMLINMDSNAPNTVVGEWLKAGGLGPLDVLRSEYRLEDSRFDFYAERQGVPILIEVKGCTLENEGLARFPDAPTERGVKHLQGLARHAAEGYDCYVVFVLQMKGVHQFGPNWATHREFGEALRSAAKVGVHVLAFDCLVTPQTMVLDAPVSVNLAE